MDPSVRARVVSLDGSDLSRSYTKLGYVGEGAYGVVLKAERNSNQYDYVAIKQMNTSREGVGIPLDAYREIKILKELQHVNCVRLECVFLRNSKKEVDLVYDYAEHDLADMIRYHRSKQNVADPRIVKSVMHQLLQGMAFLHKNWVMHRDIKPANILVMGEKSSEFGRVKIADFGLARIFQTPIRRLSDDGEVVTIWYRSPELLLGSKHYTRAIDMWAVGCIFYELMHSTPLFPGEEVKNNKFQENQVRKIFAFLGKPSVDQWPRLTDCPHYSKIEPWPKNEFRYRLAERISPNEQKGKAYALLQEMLRYDPSQRITAEDALQHPYFKEQPLPNSNAFKMANHEIFRYPQRPVKPLSMSKRVREEQILMQQQQQQQQQSNPIPSSTASAASASALMVASTAAPSASASGNLVPVSVQFQTSSSSSGIGGGVGIGTGAAVPSGGLNGNGNLPPVPILRPGPDEGGDHRELKRPRN